MVFQRQPPWRDLINASDRVGEYDRRRPWVGQRSTMLSKGALMLIDYARPSTPQCQRGRAFIPAAARALRGAVPIWCVVHAVHVLSAERDASNSFCGSCYQPMIAALGMPLHHALSLGVLSGGCALVAGIKVIRL